VRNHGLWKREQRTSEVIHDRYITYTLKGEELYETDRRKGKKRSEAKEEIGLRWKTAGSLGDP